MAEELRQQVPVIKEVLQAMGIKTVECAGLEADDLIGTLSKRCEESGMDVSVISGDRDLLQLATEHVKIRIPKTKQGRTEVEDYYADDVKARYCLLYTSFCRNCIRKLEESQKWLRAHVPSERTYAEGYITIEGAEHILNKVRNLLAQVEERVYLSCTRNYLLLLVGELETLMSQGKKVVIITDQPVTFDNAKVYVCLLYTSRCV